MGCVWWLRRKVVLSYIIRIALIWKHVAVSKNRSLTTAFHRARSTEITHRGFIVLERFTNILAVPDRTTNIIFDTTVKKYEGMQYVYKSSSGEALRRDENARTLWSPKHQRGVAEHGKDEYISGKSHF